VYKPQVLLGIRPISKGFSTLKSREWISLKKGPQNKPLKIVISDSRETA